VVAGRLRSAKAQGEGAAVTWRPRGEAAERRLEARHVINCTGPQTHPARAASPLLRRLCEAGVVRPDAFGLGIDTDLEGKVINSEGVAHERLLAMGPIAKGARWEVVAAPEIRVQAVELAERLHDRVGSRGAFDDVFLRHPRDIGESYVEHMGTAFTVGGQMLVAGAACIIHGVAPAFFTKTGSRTIERLHQRITAGRRGTTLRQ
jgi:hypothetical protein